MENLNIEKFNPLKKEVTDLVEACKKTVVSIKNDKTIDGYALMKENKSLLQKKRKEVVTLLKEGRSSALAYQKANIIVEKDLIAIMAPLEEEFNTKIKEIDLKKEMIKRQEILPDRKDKLLEINVEIEDNFILVMDDNQFNAYFNSKKEEYLFEKERKQKEEQELIDKEKNKLEEDKRIKEAADKATKEAQEQAIEDAKIAKLKSEKDASDAIKKAEDDKAKAIQDEKDIAKAREDKIIADQKAKDEKRIADEEAEEQRKEDEKQQEKEKQEKLEKQKKYIKFLADNSYTEENKDDFYIVRRGNKIILYKKVNEFII